MSEGQAQAADSLSVGDVVTVHLPGQHPQGHEQFGYRPAVVVGLPDRVGHPRFPLLIVVPLTTDRNQTWARQPPDLYPRLARGVANLPSDSICLLDQVRAVEPPRIRGYRGSLPPERLQPIWFGLRRIFAAEFWPF